MERKLLLSILAVLVLFGVVNATVFAYRSLTGRVIVAEPTAAVGVACSGFYSSADQPGIPLPEAGTNAFALTYGSNRINVTPINAICIVGNYTLYERIIVDIPITVGEWYIHDFYGFGYLSRLIGSAARVTFTVEEPFDLTIGRVTLRLFDAATGVLLAELPLDQLGASVTITLSDNEAVRLDLHIRAYVVGEEGFRVGIYVEQVM